MRLARRRSTSADRPPRRCAGSEPERRRWRPNGRRWGRSCSSARWPAPGCARPRWPAHRGPLRPGRPAAGPTDSPDPPADSMAQVRFSNGSAQLMSWSTWRLVARTLTLESSSSASSIATAVCDALCGSMPIITFMTSSLSWLEPRGHSCLRTLRARSSFEPLRGEAQAGHSSHESQPTRPAAGTLRATPPGPLNATDQPQRLQEVSSRHHGDRGSPICEPNPSRKRHTEVCGRGGPLGVCRWCLPQSSRLG